MRFHFCLKNHYPDGRLSLYDLLNFCVVGLRECGHHVTVDNDCVIPSAINIFFEQSTFDFAVELEKSKIIYGIVATEIYDGVHFNWRMEPEWDERWKNFEKIARGAAFIWAIHESSLAKYGEYAPTGLFEFGYSDKLLPKKSCKKPTIPLFFSGARSPHRVKIIDRLEKHVKDVWPDRMLP